MASSKIKGITIEIDGDTTKLGKALESAEGSSKSLQSELKGINTLLKLDPSNVELLTQKQKVLTDAIGATEDKLNTLKTAQAQVQKQFEKGEITEQQYRDFQREIVATEQKLESLKKEAKDFGSVFEQQVKEASKKVEELGNKIGDAGKKMSGVSAVASAGLVASAKSAADNESAINKYIASTGKATEETEKYKELMETIYKNNYGESIADVADKMRIVSNILGDLPDDELQKVVEKSYMLEDAYGMDFQENVRGVNALMDQFGITADQAYELINQGAQRGLNQNQDLTDQLAEYSVYYAQMGFTAEEFFTTMISGAKDGAYQIDYLNDAMKEFGIRTKDGSESSAQAFEYLGYDAQKAFDTFSKGGREAAEFASILIDELADMPDSVEKTTAGVALFGTKWEDLEISAIRSLATFETTVDSMGNTVEQTSETMYGGTSAKAQEALRSIQTAFASLGESLLPIIAPIAEKIAELADKFSNLSPTIQKIILIIMGLTAVVGPLLIMVGQVVTSISSIMPLIGKLGGALTKAGPVLTTIKGAITSVVSIISGTLMPIFSGIATFITGTLIPTITAIVSAIGWPVVAIMAVIGAITLLWNKCEWFRNAVKAIWEGIKAGFQIAYEWLSSLFTGIGEFFVGLWNKIQEFWNSVKAGFQVFYEWLSGLFSQIGEFFVGLLTKMQEFWANISASIVSFLQGLWNNIVTIFSPIVEWFTALFTSVWQSIQSILTVIVGLFKGTWEIIKAVWGVASQWFNDTVIQPIKLFFTELWNGIKETAKATVDFIVGVWVTVSTWFNENVIQPVKNFFIELWNGIQNLAKATVDFIVNLWVTIATWFNTTVIQPIKNFFVNLWNGIKNLAKSTVEGIKNIWKSVSGWFKNTVINPVKNAFGNFWSSLKTGASNAWEGIKKVFSAIPNWFRNKFTEAWTAVKNVFSTGGKIFSGIKEGILSGFKAVVNGIIGGINKVISVPFNGLNAVLNKIRNVSVLDISPFKGLWGHNPLKAPQIPKLATGTNKIESEGIYHLHEGEAVVPKKYNPALDNSGMKEAMFDALTSFTNTKMQNANNQNGISELTRLFKQYMPLVLENMGQDIVLDDRTLVGKIAPKIDKQLGVIATNKARGY